VNRHSILSSLALKLLCDLLERLLPRFPAVPTPAAAAAACSQHHGRSHAWGCKQSSLSAHTRMLPPLSPPELCDASMCAVVLRPLRLLLPLKPAATMQV
jgi:hypothetical protein